MTVEKSKRQFFFGLGTWVMCLVSCFAYGQQRADTTKRATDTLTSKKVNPFRPSFLPSDRYGDPFSNPTTPSPLFLKDPKSLSTDLQIDSSLNYTIYEKIGTVNFRPVSTMSFDEFTLEQNEAMLKDYWQSKSHALDGESAVTSKNVSPKIYLSPVLDRIFGGSYVELTPRGFVSLDFGANFQKIDNPNIPIRQQSNGGFQFDQQINLSVVGKIGTKLKVTTNFDNNNSFDFQNTMKIEYTGNKEDILKKMEIGNVSLPLNNSLISGAQNLFGVKAQMQFGKLFVTTLAATQRGKQSTLVIPGNTAGASQGKTFEIIASSYDENRNFFLSQFFRDHWESWLSTSPNISSGLNVTRVEVYEVNRQNDTQTLRNVTGFMDLGESNKIYRKTVIKQKGIGAMPANNTDNTLWQLLNSSAVPSASDTSINISLEKLGLVSGIDFVTITSARKLAATEYTINSQLGFITLQRKLQNDEALMVAFQYTYNGVVYQVGQLTEDYSANPPAQVIYMKMLRPRAISIKDNTGAIIPTWNLMMKNIYNLNQTQVTKDGFQLRVIYRDPATGRDEPQLQEPGITGTKQLIQIMGLDRLDPYNDPGPDGNFDYVEGVTINSAAGLIMYPYLQPFSEALRDLFAQEPNLSTRDYLINKYSFDTLYHTTEAEAALSLDKNKFWMTGSAKGSGGGKDITISGFNITPGSVKVVAGSTPLREGVDYTVDYTFGKVTMLNEAILSSGQAITITYEQQDPFSFQTRSLLGTRLDYKLTDDVNLGSTFLYYDERPLITRNLVGNEPARNAMYGFDVNGKKTSRFLTKMIDKLPIIQTKEPSTVTFNGEFAQLIPGTSNKVQGQGTSFIDDFENSATPYSLISPVSWKLASIPVTPTNQFDNTGGQLNRVQAGDLRAKFAWYQIDNLFYSKGVGNYPSNNPNTTNQYVRPVIQQEIFPYRDPQIGNFYEPILNLAYYPSERGPYNYNTNLNSDGTLPNPAANWGGITSAVRTEVDFDKANIEYIEFWLLDPFLNFPGAINDGAILDGKFNASNTTGGQLVFNLGSISEDVMRDGLHAFENGLPTGGFTAAPIGSTSATSIPGVTDNEWGYVTTEQFLNFAFDNNSGDRANQDVGLDGVGDANERIAFQNEFINAQHNSGAKVFVNSDPSADDFQYYLGGNLDAENAQILLRYKNFNGMDGNSPVLTGAESFAASGTTVPDNEDINQDNTLNTLDQYYTYTVPLKPGLAVGQKYIVDQIKPPVSASTSNDQVTWYLFRIPIRNFDGQVGDMTGFKNIQYIRTYLTGFTQPVVLRLAEFRTVGNRWRIYPGNLQQSTFSEPLEPNLDNVTVSVVSVEENGQGSSLVPPYIQPLARDYDNTSVIQRRLNEQSIQVCVDGLDDGDARSIYKTVTMDLFNYHHINMFLSVHSSNNSKLGDGDVQGFLRLGTDFDQNYYEIELPLTITDPNNPVFANNNRGNTAIAAVWPDINSIDLDLDALLLLKAERDLEGYSLGQLYPLKGPKAVGKHNISIIGRPDLSQLQMIMIGVRNPKGGTTTKSLNVCIWADELRLTHFDRTAGWAANAVINTKLADLGTVTSSFKYSTLGFGGIQSKISDRTRAQTAVFDISTSLSLDKFLPKKFGMKIPMFASFESNIINPGYDPANPDTRTSIMLQSFPTKALADAYLKMIQDRSYKRSISFTNVHKVRLDPKARTHFYDIENFSISYAFSQSTQSNFNLLENLSKDTKGSSTYQFNSKFKGFEPFKKLKFLSSPFLQLIKDFNFNPFPTNISLRAELERNFNKTVYRNTATDHSTVAIDIDPNFLKFFTFNRYYTARWNLSKALSIDYNAKANAIIDEPEGDITPQLRSVLVSNLKKMGRMKYFEQNITVNYSVPFDKFPVTNWVGADYRYNAGYNWTAGPLETVDSLKMGNIIKNTRDQGATGRIDFVKLYNKIGFLKNINSPKKKLTPEELKKLKKAKADTVKQPPDLGMLKSVIRAIMTLRNISGTYTQTEGIILPGFTPTPRLLGMDKTWSSPGWGFILGSQDPNYRFKASDRGWITSNPQLTNPYTQNQLKDLSLKGSLEPITDVKVQLDIKRTLTSSYQEIYRFVPDSGRFVSLGPSRSGSYKVSTITIRTAFKNNTSINSTVFNQFSQDLNIISKRFTAASPNHEAYSNQDQDVLIPAFIAAYTGKNAYTTSLSPFPNTPLPNWRIDFTGLTKIPALHELFQSITVSHAYISSYSVLNYTNSLQYGVDVVNRPVETYNKGTWATIRDPTSNQLIPVYVIGTVSISEQFAPLIGISVRTKSKLNFKFEYKTSRNLALIVSNAQITEMNTKDWSMDIGFTRNNMRMPFKDKGRVITIKNDLTFQMTLSLTSNQTIQRTLDSLSTVTNGNVNFQIRPNINYAVNKKLKIQFYVDRNVNDPLVTTSYRRATTQVGTKVLFDLSQP